jgi:hypothetical protein
VLAAAGRADEILDRKRLAERARQGLDAFVLRDLEELPTNEVAELLGIDSAAGRQRVHRARLMLRGYLSHLAGVTPRRPSSCAETGSESHREALDAHVAGCPRCVAFVESYRKTPAILRAATDVALLEDLAASLHRFLADRR